MNESEAEQPRSFDEQTQRRARPGMRDEFLERYPRICAHIIAESLGYALPEVAAQILMDAKHGRENWCEWIYACYGRDPRAGVRAAIRGRHRHTGYMASYVQARAIVQRRIETGERPLFASWF
jgi:hypothetical protein